MPHISKKQLKKETAKDIRERFIKTVASLGGGNKKGKSSERDFFGELFTSTEQVMLAKRLAMIFMLEEGMSSYKVCKILNLSPSTTARFKKEIRNGSFTHIESISKNKNSKNKIWDELEILLKAGLPPIGKDRWKWLDEYTQK